ncbi:MAG TPA: HEAT repeat domain-containing protein [Methanoregulaceae archaeon]|nr:HEAT repeat domain-containing protein [Methanoregulaceae archaeon]HQA80046.1 HEAT repeat domain-containing protein [Methanoregulaceae archaeon]
MTIEKPDTVELTRGETTIKGGCDNQSSLLIFYRTQPVPDGSIPGEDSSADPSKGIGSDFNALIGLLSHEEPDIRITAARTLGKQGDPNAIEPLFRACMDENCGVKSAARDALALIVAQMHINE